MKKIILIAVLALITVSTHAQVSFGAQIGANLGMGHSDIKGNVYSNAVSVTNDPKVGFLVGVLAEMDFGKLGFRPEFNIVQKGSKNGYSGYVYGYGIGGGASKRSLIYVEIPLNVVYNLHVGSFGKAFFGLGPAIGIGVTGKDKNVQDYNSGDYVTRNIKFDGEKTDVNASGSAANSHLKRTDVGINILAGFQFSMNVFAKIGYTHGLTNIDPDKDTQYINSTYKNRGVTVCVGYMLGSKRK